ncbi:AAA family ATPase [Alicyclobacillus kakegawensis]|uniref:AAA family ATPase n=1 Tax=Alicyclobacillus kakegawensis TaxID=392012 RepID=UPI00082BC2C4|nr:SMC family ATPase [Alicyclobacillus kakegawensis]
MKPIELRIRGLHSFREEQVIPFAELAQDGVFGIFGPTGSGKSSILDAMTLALFGSVTRADHNTRGILNHAEDRLAVAFEFAIGRAQDRRRYRVERAYRRRDEVAVQNVRSRLVEVTDGGDVVLADKDSEVTARVKDILGLELDDFTRAVVLPQGRFAEFLNLRGADRNRMLQRLFALERYGDRLMQRLRERWDERRLQHEAVVNRQQGLGDASPEALAAAREAEAQAALAEAVCRQRLDKLSAEYDEARRLRAAQAELAQVQAGIAEHQRQAESMQQLAGRLARAAAAEAVWPVVEAQQTAALEADAARTQLAAAETAWDAAHAREQALRSQSEAAKQRLAQQQPALAERRHRLTALQQSERELLDLRQRLAELDERRRAMDRAWADKTTAERHLRQQLQAAEHQAADAEAKLAASRVPIPLRQALQAAKDGEGRYQQAAAQARRAEQRVRQREEAKDAAAAQLARLRAEQERVEQAWREARAQLEALAPPLDEEELRQRQTRLAVSGRPLWEAWRNGLARWQERVQQCEQAKAACAKAQERLAEAERALERVLARQREAQRLQGEAVWVDRLAMAQLLAEGLQEGDPCPVCGSVHHPQLAVPAGAAHVAGLAAMETAAAALRMAQDELDQAQARVRADQQELAVAASQYESIQQAAREQAVELADVYKKVTAAWPEWENPAGIGRAKVPAAGANGAAGAGDEAGDGVFGLEPGPRPVHLDAAACQAFAAFLNLEHQRLQELSRGLEDWRQRQAAWEAQLAQREEARRQVQERLARAEAVLSVAEAEWQRARADAEEASAALCAAWRQWCGSLAAAGWPGSEAADENEDDINQATYAGAWLAQAVADVEERDRQMEAANQELMEARQVQQEVQPKLEAVSAELQSLAEERRRAEWQTQDWVAKADDLAAVLDRETGGRPIAEALAELATQAERLTAAVEQAEAELAAASEQLGRLDKERTAWHTRVETATARLETAAAALDAALADAGFASIGDVADARFTDTEQSEARARLQAYEDEGRRLAEERRRLLATLDGRFVDDDAWEAICQAQREAEEALSVATRELGRAEEAARDVERRHAEWTRLEEQRRALQAELDNLQTLRQLFSGNKFVEFVAQEQLELVARMASDRLHQLTRGRYALEVAADGRFVMRDDFNGGVRRPVTSLSGGETFLTSLALALSLSTQIQLRGRHPLEFFFLDEGFGTLDAERLDVVMSTLERLRLEQLTIGVISHVPELRARMPRRLIVQPAEPAGRGSRVRLELA